jgi:hypothetical protein
VSWDAERAHFGGFSTFFVDKHPHMNGDRLSAAFPASGIDMVRSFASKYELMGTGYRIFSLCNSPAAGLLHGLVDASSRSQTDTTMRKSLLVQGTRRCLDVPAGCGRSLGAVVQLLREVQVGKEGVEPLMERRQW